jgi:hypothetical protein
MATLALYAVVLFGLAIRLFAKSGKAGDPKGPSLPRPRAAPGLGRSKPWWDRSQRRH